MLIEIMLGLIHPLITIDKARPLFLVSLLFAACKEEHQTKKNEWNEGERV
jgi:hypothetical protein